MRSLYVCTARLTDPTPFIPLRLHDDDGWQPKGGAELAGELVASSRGQSCPAGSTSYVIAATSLMSRLSFILCLWLRCLLTPALPFASLQRAPCLSIPELPDDTFLRYTCESKKMGHVGNRGRS